MDLAKIDREILDYWKQNDIFYKSLMSHRDIKQITFYEGPPTANGLPGIHHVLARTVKDIFCRYKTMMGYKVNRKAGWDTHGLPVEIEMEKFFNANNHYEIENKVGVDIFNRACKRSVYKYIDDWKLFTEKMGYWTDLENSYYTCSNEYIESVWWAVKELFNKNLIQKDYKVLPVCTSCESALSANEVSQNYKDVKDVAITVKFPIKSPEFQEYSFLVWTTTPWTLMANSALAVNPNNLFVAITTDAGEKYILGRDRLCIIKDNYKIDKEFFGKELEYIEYIAPYPYFPYNGDLEKYIYIVVLADYVTSDTGTGIVHIAPMYGEDDFKVGKKYNLFFNKNIRIDGTLKNDAIPFGGYYFKEANPKIIHHLLNQNLIYDQQTITHSYPHCWRHQIPLMYYAMPSWFVKTTNPEAKKTILNAASEINWLPNSVGENRFNNWINGDVDWCISRDRFWGTPLPIWYYEDNNGEKKYICIGSIDELKEYATNWDDVFTDEIDLHIPLIDSLSLKTKEGYNLWREKAVLDCWFDSGSVPFSQLHYPFINRDTFEKSFPADFIAEGIDQTRGWFYTLLVINSLLFNKSPFKNVVVNGHILDKDGKKMSKSLNNTVEPNQLIDKYGADIIRWYLVGSNPISESQKFNEDEIQDLNNKLFGTLENIFNFFYQKPEPKKLELNSGNISHLQEIDIWMKARLEEVTFEYIELMEGYQLTKTCKLLSDFIIEDISNWYIRLNRKRFLDNIDSKEYVALWLTLKDLLFNVLKLIAPIAPFISEKLFLSLKDSKQEYNINEESIHLCLLPQKNPHFSTLRFNVLNPMKKVKNIVFMARSIRTKNNLKIKQPLIQILISVNDDSEIDEILKFKDIILDELNVKSISFIRKDSIILNKRVKPNFKSIGPKFGKDVQKVKELISKFDKRDIEVLEKYGSLPLDEGYLIDIEDVEIFTEDLEGWASESDNERTVALNTVLTPELIEEGKIREVISKIQNERKLQGYKIEQILDIYLNGSGEFFEILNRNFEFIKSKTGLNSLKTKLIPGLEEEFYFEIIN